MFVRITELKFVRIWWSFPVGLTYPRKSHARGWSPPCRLNGGLRDPTTDVVKGLLKKFVHYMTVRRLKRK
jgi:hypothetical protein